MADEYVKKEVFDARMDRMEALLEKTLIEMKADNEKLRSEVSGAITQMKADNEKLRSEMNGLRSEVNGAITQMKADNEKLRSEMRNDIGRLEAKIEVQGTRIEAVNMRVENVQTIVSWLFAAVSIVIALLTLTPTLADRIKKFRKPQITMEDVENAIDIAIKKATGLQKSQ